MGDVNTPKPCAVDLLRRAKWVAWKNVEGVPKNEAEDLYVALVDLLLEEEKSFG